MEDDCNTLLWSGAKSLGIMLDTSRIDQLLFFVKELLEANQRLNLTRLTTPMEIAEKLLLDSMFAGKFIKKGAQVLDLGAGAGVPGIPLKISRPDLSLNLIDARRKRVSFLKYVIRRLGLKGITARHIRAEELAEEGAVFKIIVCRAVSSLDRLVPIALPLLEENGMFVAMKGEGYRAEIAVLKSLGEIPIGSARLPVNELSIDVETYSLPITGIDRALVMVKHTG